MTKSSIQREAMTPAEIVARFMEERPELPVDGYVRTEWWILDTHFTGDDIDSGVVELRPRSMTLDRLRLVEERLIEMAKDPDAPTWCLHLNRYRDLIEETTMRMAWHASAEQKLAALAEVLRPAVEKGEKG